MAIARDEIIERLTIAITEEFERTSHIGVVPWNLTDDCEKASVAAQAAYRVVLEFFREIAEETRGCHHGKPLPERYLERL